MPKKRIGELPSGKLRKKVYSHTEMVDGKPHKVYVSVTASTAKELDLKIAEVKLGLSMHKAVPTEDMTLRQAIDRYLAENDALLSPSTVRGYRVIRENAFPLLMDRPLRSLDTDVLKRSVNEECKRIGSRGTPLSAKTVCNEYGLIRTVIRQYAPRVDTHVRLPQKHITHRDISTPETIAALVKGTELELPVLLAMWLSFSMSELQGLTRSGSISADGSHISIRQVMVLGPEGYTVKQTGKHPARERTLPLPPYIRSLIDALPPDQDKLVTIPPVSLGRRFSRMVKKAGLPHMTFHDLRHVNASTMALLHVPDKYAQERGGWATEHIMHSVYTQAFRSERTAVDEQIDDYFGRIVDPDADTEYRIDPKKLADALGIPVPKDKDRFLAVARELRKLFAP